MKSIETEAGTYCTEMHRRFAGGDWTKQLPSHIRVMLGSNDFGQPLWRRRAMPPDGDIFVLDRFEDYLTKGFREGLGFDSWWTIHSALVTQGQNGLKAIVMIEAEIGEENYRRYVEADRWRTLGEGREAAPVIHRAARGKPVGDTYRLSKSKTNADRIIARLKRDHPEIAERLAAGEFKSAAAAAREAGLKIDPSPVSQLRRWWNRASNKERVAFLEFVEHEPDRSEG